MVFLKIMNPLQKICASQSVKGEGGVGGGGAFEVQVSHSEATLTTELNRYLLCCSHSRSAHKLLYKFFFSLTKLLTMHFQTKLRPGYSSRYNTS